MASIARLDTIANSALKNEIISRNEVKNLIAEAKGAIAQSGNPAATRAAVLRRFDAWAANIYDSKVVSKLNTAVKEMTSDAKTYSWVGVQVSDIPGRGGSSRTSGGESPRRTSGGESPRRTSGGEGYTPRPSPRRSSGGESYTPRRSSGGESYRSGRISGGEW